MAKGNGLQQYRAAHQRGLEREQEPLGLEREVVGVLA